MRTLAWTVAAVATLTVPVAASAQSPYPASEVVLDVAFAPVDEIVCQADGSDNWPITWAADGHLYTSFGDGWGFDPGTDEKLSMGFARISGPGDAFSGENVRSESGERTGDGPAGEKASGMLALDGTLYMLVRNADNSVLFTSSDDAATWTVADWRFTTGFGAPTFLNFGQDYAGRRDDYVYVYSQDGPSAYEVYDGAALARVPMDRIGEQDAYEFFAGLEAGGAPAWTGDVESRAPVLEHEGRSYRMDAAYVAPLGRYFVLQAFGRENDGWAMFEAPEPWGPWSTVFFTEDWDLDVNVHGFRLPTKWISADARTMYLLFSGRGDYDAFCVRRMDLTLAPGAADGDADIDSDGDIDGAVASDGDADADGDGDSDADTDTDADADADADGDGDATADTDGDGGGGGSSADEGCSCRAAPSPAGSGLTVLVVALALLSLRSKHS